MDCSSLHWWIYYNLKSHYIHRSTSYCVIYKIIMCCSYYSSRTIVATWYTASSCNIISFTIWDSRRTPKYVITNCKILIATYCRYINSLVFWCNGITINCRCSCLDYSNPLGFTTTNPAIPPSLAFWTLNVTVSIPVELS